MSDFLLWEQLALCVPCGLLYALYFPLKKVRLVLKYQYSTHITRLSMESQTSHRKHSNYLFEGSFCEVAPRSPKVVRLKFLTLPTTVVSNTSTLRGLAEFLKKNGSRKSEKIYWVTNLSTLRCIRLLYLAKKCDPYASFFGLRRGEGRAVSFLFFPSFPQMF